MRKTQASSGTAATLHSHFSSAKSDVSNPMHNGSDEMSMETRALSASGGDSGDDTEDEHDMVTTLLGGASTNTSFASSFLTFFGGKNNS